MWKPDTCIYHDNCDDGFAAAWVIQKRWPDVHLIPYQYGQDITFNWLRFHPDRNGIGNVIMVDVSMPKHMVEAMLHGSGAATSVLVLDHHETAERRAHQEWPLAYHWFAPGEAPSPAGVDASNARYMNHFDLSKAGCRLAWEFAFGDAEPMPKLLEHIEDRDLWHFALDDTPMVTLWLRSFSRDMTVWDDLIEASKRPLWPDTENVEWNVLEEMVGIRRYHERLVREIVKTSTVGPFDRYENVPIVAAPYELVSDVGSLLLDRYQFAPFVVMMVFAYGAMTYSLRSQDRRENVAEIAERYGGGGHRNAAGFRAPR